MYFDKYGTKQNQNCQFLLKRVFMAPCEKQHTVCACVIAKMKRRNFCGPRGICAAHLLQKDSHSDVDRKSQVRRTRLALYLGPVR